MFRQLRAKMRRDSGSTMVPVIGLVALAGILTALVVSATVHAVSFTTLTRAGVQAQAAADAGVEFMRAQLATGTCPPGNELSKTYGEVFTGTSGAAELAQLGIDGSRPYFDVTVQYQQLISGILTGGWSAGCPSGLLGLLTFQVQIVSTGYASSPGVAGASGLDEHTVEVVHGWNLTPPTPSTGIDPSGAPIYSYVSGGVNGLTLANDSPSAAIHFRNGSFTCTNSTIEGSVVVNGNATVSTACTITGHLLASGSVTMPTGSSRVEGSVHAGGVVSGWSFSQDNSGAFVGGSVVAVGPVSVRGNVVGNVDAGPTTGQTTIHATAAIGGALTVAGTLAAAGGVTGCPCTNAAAKTALQQKPHVGGAIQFGVSGMAGPSSVSPPDWVDFKYKASDWKDADGNAFSVITLNPLLMSDCSWSWDGSSGIAKLKQALDSATPVIVDARSCGTLDFYGSLQPKLNQDLVIIATGFNSGARTWSSKTGEPRRLWIITPDDVANGQPSCGGLLGLGNKQGMTFVSGFKIDPSVTATVYTPCSISNSSSQWYGQFYGGTVITHGDVDVTYAPNGLPGVDLDSGGSGGGILPPLLPQLGTLGDLVYYRDVTG